jgi:hypothetical protein
VNIKIVCLACEDTLSIITAHVEAERGWGRVLLCREEIDDLRDDLKRHRRDTCNHYKAQREEYLLRKLDTP